MVVIGVLLNMLGVGRMDWGDWQDWLIGAATVALVLLWILSVSMGWM